MNKTIEQENHRMGKIDNAIRNLEQLQADVDYMHLLAAQERMRYRSRYMQRQLSQNSYRKWNTWNTWKAEGF